MTLQLTIGDNVEILINKSEQNELVESKKLIDDIDNKSWTKYRNLVNPYETVIKDNEGKNKKLNRAYFKLKEMMIDDKEKFENLQSAVALAEGPGGFIQFLTDYYKNIEVYGITLKYDTESKAASRHFNTVINSKNLKIIYGDESLGHDGNLYNKEVVQAFANQVGKKVDLVTADGGFDVDEKDKSKEVEHLRLFLAETLTAFKVLRKDGSFILKIYDIFTRPTLELLFLLASTFKSTALVKPVTSRPANSERYVVCHGFKGYETDIHVDINDKIKYTSILSMNKNEEKKFKLFLENLENANANYIQIIIGSIKNVVNAINRRDKNRHQLRKDEQQKRDEQQTYKEAWEKVYEKAIRVEKKLLKKKERKESKKGNSEILLKDEVKDYEILLKDYEENRKNYLRRLRIDAPLRVDAPEFVPML